VYSADVSRGRADDYSQFIGTAQVVLNNNSRLFDPFYTSGTYYGKLLPRRQIKIEGISNSVTYPVFRGFVDGFPAAWDQAGKFATTTLSCFDGLSLLSQELLPDYVYDYTKTLSPTNYWRCNDGQSSTIITDVVAGLNVQPSVAGSNYKLGTPMSSALLSDNVLCPASGYANTPVTFKTQTANQITWAGWFQLANTGTAANCILYFASIDKFIQINVSPPNGYAQVAISDLPVVLGTVGLRSTDLGYSYNTTPFFFTITWIKATKVSAFYINGVLQVGTLLVGANCAVDTGPVSKIENFGVGIQEHSVYTTAFTAAQVLELYNYNINNILETSAARMTRLFGYTSWDASLQSITASPVATVGALSPPNSNLVAEMQTVNNSEDGDLFVTRAGVIKFTDRNYVYTNTSSNTSQATFAGGSIPFQPSVQINYDAAAIRNDITVTFTGGGQTSTTNSASVTAYGTNAMNTGTQLSTQAQAVTLAAYQATVNGQLLTNISPVSVGVTAATSDWSTLLGLELLDRYTLTVQPPTGNSISQAELINRIEHRIVPGQWQMTVDGSQRYTAWFILDKSSLNGTDLLQ
jgi:hypothetical protein